MTKEAALREQICRIGKSLFDRGLTNGASGNISARLASGQVLMTPTGRSLGDLDPAELSLLSKERLLSGLIQTKESPLHNAFYETRGETGAVIHLHSTHSVALSMLPEIDPNDVLPPLTAYSIMRVGRLKLLPVFLPGDPAMADAIRGLAGKRSAVLLANHGPVVSGTDLEATGYAIEELEETAKLALLTRGMSPKVLSEADCRAIAKKFDLKDY
jgi:3-dehydro-4-phosphotetronate decarboxylase